MTKQELVDMLNNDPELFKKIRWDIAFEEAQSIFDSTHRNVACALLDGGYEGVSSDVNVIADEMMNMYEDLDSLEEIREYFSRK